LAYRRLVSKLTKENLWMYILAMLTERPMYGYEVANELRSRFQIDVATITVYVVLYRMSAEGLVRRLTDRGNKLGLRKVFYQVTERGLEAFKDGLRFIEETLRTLAKT